MKAVAVNPNKYISAQTFFNDYYKYRKKLDAHFSHELWSAELGFKSKSFLRMICSGRREITTNLIELFSQKEKLSEKQKIHLNLIALYQKTKISSEKKIYLDKIFESLDPDPINHEIKQYAEFISDLDLVTIQLLGSFEDGPKTVEETEDLLKLSKKQIKEKLMILFRMGLVEFFEKENQEFWKSTNKAFTVTDKELTFALREYYLLTLKEAEKQTALDKVDSLGFRTAFFALSTEEAKIFENECQAFMKKMRNQFSSTKLSNKSLYKINLISYPISEKSEN